MTDDGDDIDFENINPSNFTGVFARLEIFALAGVPDRMAVCMARRPEAATVSAALDPGTFCGLLITLAEGEVWPVPRRRQTSILEAFAGGTVLWLCETPQAAQAVLPILQRHGAVLLAGGEPERPQ